MIKDERRTIATTKVIIKRLKKMREEFQKIMAQKAKNHDDLLESQKKTMEQ